MVQQPQIQQSVPARPGANGSIWSTGPMLRPSAAEDYYGRVFIEVFESDSQVTIVGGDRSLLPRARTVLTGGYIPLRDSALPWTNEPATGKRANQAFLGRVVVEMWSNQAVVGITGADPRVVERATQRLMLL
jgi:hypothetical protein